VPEAGNSIAYRGSGGQQGDDQRPEAGTVFGSLTFQGDRVHDRRERDRADGAGSRASFRASTTGSNAGIALAFADVQHGQPGRSDRPWHSQRPGPQWSWDGVGSISGWALSTWAGVCVLRGQQLHGGNVHLSQLASRDQRSAAAGRITFTQHSTDDEVLSEPAGGGGRN